MDYQPPPDEGGSDEEASDAVEAKRRTIAELRDFEQRKGAAQITFEEKLRLFSTTLSEDERTELGDLLGQDLMNAQEEEKGDGAMAEPVDSTGGIEVVVQLSLTRLDEGASLSVQIRPGKAGVSAQFVHLKPMQKVDDAVHLKPMQKVDDDVHLKPMQKVDDAVHLKPMQKVDDDVHLKPMQKVDDAVHLKPMQKVDDPTGGMK
jgi:hypothetical protein